MYRTINEKLDEWKNRENRRPMVVRGPRQTGKTWLLREFGATAYQQVVYIDFEENRRMENFFSNSTDTERLITGLELYAGHKIDPANTLLIFDEIQEVPAAMASLKCFTKEAPQYQIVCASSELKAHFPVAWVEIVDLHPMSFYEFLLALDKKKYVELLQKGYHDVAPTFQQDYINLLKDYFFVGGMPAVVQVFAETRDYNQAREVQNRILTTYDRDFSRYAPGEVTSRIRALWNSIPAQLNRENKKLTYGLIKEGARAREYERALKWLSDSGLIHEIHRVKEPELPLEEYEDERALKAFLLDVGLLSYQLGVRQDLLLDGDAIFTACHGALTEQFVLQELAGQDKYGIYYWTAERGTSEVDFLLDSVTQAIPVEIAVRQNLQSKKMKVYREKFHPKLCVRTSLTDYRRGGEMLNLPLWTVNSAL